MTDPIDKACEVEELHRTNALQAQADKANLAPKYPDGICANCERELVSGHYCNADCRDDHANRLRCKSLR